MWSVCAQPFATNDGSLGLRRGVWERMTEKSFEIVVARTNFGSAYQAASWDQGGCSRLRAEAVPESLHDSLRYSAAAAANALTGLPNWRSRRK